jgi:hypothetical protein
MAMPRFRFSLLGLGGLVAAVAGGCAALVYASPGVAGAAWTLTILLLIFGLVPAVLMAPAQRGFWCGFAICGWMYVLIQSGPLSGLAQLLTTGSMLRWAAEAMPQATTTTFEHYFAPGFPGAAPGPGFGAGGEGGGPGAGGEGLAGLPPGMGAPAAGLVPVQVTNHAYIDSFLRIGHSYCTLLLALAGGLLGRWAAVKEDIAGRTHRLQTIQPPRPA